MRGTKAKAGHRRKRPDKTPSDVRHSICVQCDRRGLIMRETGTCWQPWRWDKCREIAEKRIAWRKEHRAKAS